MPSPRQLPLTFPETALSFEEMTLSGAHRGICAAIRKTERWPYHAFCLTGSLSSGLTTIARAWAKERGAQYLNAGSASQKQIEELVQLVDQDLVIDDVDALNDAQALLFVLSAIKRNQNYILLTAHTPPTQWVFQSPDLKSRLQSAPLAELPAPDEELMRARLRRACARSYLDLPSVVEDFLVTRLGLDYSQIEQTADSLAGATGDRPLTIPLAREILGDGPDIGQD